MPEPTNADITVTAVRKALIAESHELLRLAKDYRETIEEPAVTTFEFSVLEAVLKANAYSYLLAAVLRQVEGLWSPAEAARMAELFDTVMDVGNEALELANDDLDEQAGATSAPLAVGTRVRVDRPGGPYDGRIGSIAVLAPYGQAGTVGVAIDGHEGVNVFPADDVTILPREAVAQ